MKKPYFLDIVRVYDTKQDYEEQTEGKIFTPMTSDMTGYFYAHKKPGDTITIEVTVEDWDTQLYCSSPDVDIYCGETYGRS